MNSSRPTFRFLVAESETPEAREARRRSVGRSSGETYLDILGRLAPGAAYDHVMPADADAALPPGADLAGYDAVFLTGSPPHLYEETPETRRTVAFMRAVFAAGTPSFGSCAGLQVATVAAGGSVRPNARRREAAFARRITSTAAGRAHPLLAGRLAAYDAPGIHTDEIDALPPGATLLAGNTLAEPATAGRARRRRGRRSRAVSSGVEGRSRGRGDLGRGRPKGRSPRRREPGGHGAGPSAFQDVVRLRRSPRGEGPPIRSGRPDPDPPAMCHGV